MSRSLIVLPEDTVQPILDAIRLATKTLRIKMFVFSDSVLMKALTTAHENGVEVRVMLNPARRSGQAENAESRKTLEAAGIEVIDSNPAFDVTHEKSMIVDDEMAFVQSLNWKPENFTDTRDYAILTRHRHEVDDIGRCFEADWNRKEFDPDPHSHLIWCSGYGRDRIARFIDEARHTLFVQNERYQDVIIIERLVRARLRGVKVHVMARPPHTLKKDKLIEGVSGLRIMDDVGIKIHKLSHLRLHAKMLMADGARAIIGSINLTPGSFDSRRELAIEVNDGDIVGRLKKIVQHDWKNSHPMDLSDGGLLSDLERHKVEGVESLALRTEDHRGRSRKMQ
jgi:phosphatidylserine/phosphatidylglycerophosphate/cardiolipin synthase-like enzyme